MSGRWLTKKESKKWFQENKNNPKAFIVDPKKFIKGLKKLKDGEAMKVPLLSKKDWKKFI